jgi:hypothetical protein
MDVTAGTGLFVTAIDPARPYAPFDHPSVWTEVGPVYIHASRCDGSKPTGRLPGCC